MSKVKKQKGNWIIVTNKKTYLFLLAALLCIIFLAGDAVYVFALKQREAAEFIGDFFIGIVLLIVCIYLFVRFNTYSHFFNPEHPKPEEGNEDK